MEAAQLPVNRQMHKEEAIVHIHNGILLGHKKWNPVFCDSMDVTRGYYGKWNKSEKDKYHMILFICEI